MHGRASLGEAFSQTSERRGKEEGFTGTRTVSSGQGPRQRTAHTAWRDRVKQWFSGRGPWAPAPASPGNLSDVASQAPPAPAESEPLKVRPAIAFPRAPHPAGF